MKCEVDGTPLLYPYLDAWFSVNLWLMGLKSDMQVVLDALYRMSLGAIGYLAKPEIITTKGEKVPIFRFFLSNAALEP